eukprot:Rhum_TRINITY_DN15242_c1_g1::Rhum_TRINITY_DN15242_c1_g1_i1::g.143477::m.143477
MAPLSLFPLAERTCPTRSLSSRLSSFQAAGIVKSAEERWGDTHGGQAAGGQLKRSSRDSAKQGKGVCVVAMVTSKFESMKGLPAKALTGLDALFDSLASVKGDGIAALWESSTEGQPGSDSGGGAFHYLRACMADTDDPVGEFLMKTLPRSNAE